MSGVGEPQSGISSWMSSIRMSMVRDPCRQLFEDQVQSHGFIFLDDYLDNILASPITTQEGIIELVKTPSRKKNAPRRTRAATAAATKTQAIISLSFEDDHADKENVNPHNTFHQALLKVKDKDGQILSRNQRPQLSGQILDGPQNPSPKKTVTIVDAFGQLDAEVVSSLAAPRSVLPLDSEAHERLSRLPEMDSRSLAAPQQEQAKELSMIAEGDESAERSRTSIQTTGYLVRSDSPPLIGGDVPRREGSYPLVRISSSVEEAGQVIAQREGAASNQNGDHTETSNIALSALNDTFHSIPLDSPQSSKDEQLALKNSTAPLPTLPELDASLLRANASDAKNVPPLAISSSQSAPALTTVMVPVQDESPHRTLVSKGSVPQFPTLPAPSPLRKSMRIQREPSVGMAQPAAAIAPAPSGPGKRTSWLMKAREVKAMESNGTSSSLLGVVVPPTMNQGTKRKSREISGAEVEDAHPKEDGRRRSKTVKTSDAETAPMVARRESVSLSGDGPATRLPNPTPVVIPPPIRVVHVEEVEEFSETRRMDDGDQSIIGRFKRTVEDLEARIGKSIAKSLGGTAATAALAEARAAAEARVAERNKTDLSQVDSHIDSPMSEDDVNPSVQELVQPSAQQVVPIASSSSQHTNHPNGGRKLSVSDLTLSNQDRHGKFTAKVFQPIVRPSTASSSKLHIGDESTTTTPPHSPPSNRNSGFRLFTGPVFNKPPPVVFVPPNPKEVSCLSSLKDDPPRFPVSTAFSLPAPMSLGVPIRLPSSPRPEVLQKKIQEDIPAWIPPTEDMGLTSGSLMRTQPDQPDGRVNDIDDDDSWPLEEKLAAGAHQWVPFDFSRKEDDTTWSTLPSESQRGDTGRTRSGSQVAYPSEERADLPKTSAVPHLPGSFEMDVESTKNAENRGVERETSVLHVQDLDELESEGHSVLDAVEPVGGVTRSQSQMSVTSTSSSQSQVGFFGQASKLVNSMLGVSKKGKPEVKSLQLAAAAAKKQQEEKDKKAARLKEMEHRRQLALQRKADEEKTRAQEEERKLREDAERRKRDREEHTDKRPLKIAPGKKAEEESTKKRKIVNEAEKKLEAKKPPSRDKKDVFPSSKIMKPTIATPGNKVNGISKPAKSNITTHSHSATHDPSMQGVAASSSSTLKNAVTETFTTKNVVEASVKGKGKAIVHDQDISESLPSQLIQNQMAARLKAQMQAINQPTEVPSESIELPDINSEYSDSEDEDRPRTFDPPDWAQSPELKLALQMQSTVNPDDIFGAIKPLRMEEMFRTRQSRFRARTSSANWSGLDKLTVEEEREYARRMGFNQ